MGNQDNKNIKERIAFLSDIRTTEELKLQIEAHTPIVVDLTKLERQSDLPKAAQAAMGNAARIYGIAAFGLWLACGFGAYAQEAVLPLNLNQLSSAIAEQRQFDALMKSSVRKASKDPVLYQAYAAQKVLRNNPHDLNSNAVLCDAYKRTGYLMAAAKQCRAVLSIDPASSLARTNIAEIAMRMGQAEAAKTLLQNVLRDDPHYSPANLLLAEIAKRRGESAEAMGQIDQALQNGPDAASLLALGEMQMQAQNYDQASNSFLKVLQLDPHNAQALADLANLFAGRGDYARALDFAQKAANADPKSALAQYTLGTQYENSARLEEASVSYASAIKLDGNFGLAHRAMGLLLLKKGSPVDALTSLNRALQLMPGDETIMAAQARAYATTGNPDAANRIMDTIPKPAIDTQAADKKMAQALAQAGKLEQTQQYEQARQVYERLAIDRPDRPEPFYNIGRIYMIAQQPENAERFYRLALERNSAHGLSMAGLSQVQCFQGNSAEARQDYSQALAAGFIDNGRQTQQYLDQYCPVK